MLFRKSSSSPVFSIVCYSSRAWIWIFASLLLELKPQPTHLFTLPTQLSSRFLVTAFPCQTKKIGTLVSHSRPDIRFTKSHNTHIHAQINAYTHRHPHTYRFFGWVFSCLTHSKQSNPFLWQWFLMMMIVKSWYCLLIKLKVRIWSWSPYILLCSSGTISYCFLKA